MSLDKKNIYFASDFHLGVPSPESSLKREKLICKWLDQVKHDAAAIYLVGDIFDFWFEHRYTVPKGNVRLLGKIAEITDAGIPVSFFVGNHDLWMKDYFEKELHVTIHHEPITRTFGNKVFYIGHGDGLGPGDNWYKLLRSIFVCKPCQWLFSRLHPNLSFYIAKKSSKRSRIITGDSDEDFLGKENEWLYIFSKEYLLTHKVDYFVFGHRHLPLDLDIEGKARYINLGEWINYSSYAVFDGNDLQLKEFKE
ncbi:MAG: UDP-2,3-diacylglucosamine diphosphatase [bacterium]|nr:UDP-2,3-diacylglucosamine diphosphatase [bacterium]